MKKSLISFVVIMAIVVFASDSMAQSMEQGRMRGWGRRGSYQRLYDPKTVKTIDGEVAEMEYFTPQQGMGQGVHIQLKTEKETLSVHLGPRWFLDNQDVQIEKGDQITVKGSLVKIKDKPTVIAAEIEKEDEILILRDSDGFPRWAGWRRKGQ